MTLEQIFRHLSKAHNQTDRQILVGMAQKGGENEFHDSLHLEATNHTHDAAGEVVSETKIAMGKTIVYTVGGWALDATAQEALQELNSIVNNQNVEIKINSSAVDEIEFTLRTPMLTTFTVKAANFIDGVKLLLGTGYEAIEREQNG